MKSLMSEYGVVKNEGITHNEYDIIMENGIRFEIKTARIGRNNSFQFNGINPNYNYDYLICIGICSDKAVYKIFNKSSIIYVHDKNNRGYYMKEADINKKLSSMNPSNNVNLKLTLQLNQMFDLNEMPDVISKIMIKY
ncbi:hypothetical protein HUN03_00288 [Mycoplasmopsis anatis]|uniref:hypothetical protein n=1 Tax=Mycoplasmopsis anatis TaxID=171279 RepID=UPI001C4DF4E1|nr:hypothetical protein [Mycoplasmopsis anatis]MBW0594694.1 hypothetical protein [Mycoplasmopsis anatis]MBW0595511.1 hypothetical protein [Mycoplasmopsis anatis]MBW0598273.1 hypothetical protein [Mycoplasmopsis anatis]MBW0599124.1 hypothetical protein [Mycoplasmopsis anatis]MBW0601131.1 hypothetical protein [Mycoplasmopsis anatis]